MQPKHQVIKPTLPALVLPIEQTKPSKQTIDVQPRIITQLHQLSHQGITFNLVSYDSRDYQLEIADQAGGPGTIWEDAEAVGIKKNAHAVINAGFFTPEGKPLGLVIDNGVKRGFYNASSLGAGIYHTTATGAVITRSTQSNNILKTKPKHLLQSGPMLVENSKNTNGLSSKNSRVRSFIATDGENHWLIGHASSCNLSELGKALASLNIPDLKIVSALNLDGGRSSDLWVSKDIKNGPLTIRPFWNKPVRNFLVLKKQ